MVFSLCNFPANITLALIPVLTSIDLFVGRGGATGQDPTHRLPILNLATTAKVCNSIY